ncbi:MAG: hypothetical protein LBH39_03595, partial [Clostridiales Family XIII bacterium]|nr:hypothetical protein [Clostridiales Family XIII bacterium]
IAGATLRQAEKRLEAAAPGLQAMEGKRFYDEFEAAIGAEALKKLQASRQDALRYQLATAREKIEAQSRRAGSSSFLDGASVSGTAKFDATVLKNVDGLLPKMTALLEYARTFAVDQYQPLRKMASAVNAKLAAKGKPVLFGRQDMDMAAHLAYNASNKSFNSIAGDFVSSLEGPPLLDSEGQPVPSLKGVLAPLRDASGKISDEVYRAFGGYAKAIDALDRLKYGKGVFSSTTDESEIRAAVAEYEQEFPQFPAALSAVLAWQDVIMQEYAVKTGMDGGLYNTVWKKMYPHHLPQYRVRTDGRGKGAMGKNMYEPFMRTAKAGGTGITYHPIDGLMMQVDKIMKAANARALWGLVHDTFNSSEEARDAMKEFIVPTESTSTPHTFDARQTKRNLEYALFGFAAAKIAEGDPAAGAAFEAMSMQEKFEWLANEGYTDVVDSVINDAIKFFTVDRVSKDSDVFSIPVGDGYVHYQVLDPSFATMLEGMAPEDAGNFMAFLMAGKRAMTALTTGLNLTFSIGSNLVRDIPVAIIQGPWSNPVSAAVDLFGAMGDVLSHSDVRKLAQAGGAGFDSMMGAERARTYRSIQAGLGIAPKGVAANAASAGSAVLNLLEGINNFIESVPRQAAFNHVYRKMGRQNAMIAAQISEEAAKANPDAAAIAALEAKVVAEADRLAAAQTEYSDVTINFKQHGAGLGKLRGSVYFLNSYIQAMDKLGRSLITQKDRKRLGQAWLKMLMTIGLVSALVAVQNDGDPDYGILTDYEKDGYLHIFKLPDGTWIRVRKPQEYGVIGNVIERGVHSHFTGEWGENYKALLESSLATLTPPTDVILSPVIMTAINKPWYDKISGEIVSSRRWGDYLATRRYDEIYDEGTSRVAKKLAEALPDVKAFGILNTPMGIDYALQQTTGFVGQWMLPAFRDTTYDWKQIFFGRFYIDPTAKNRLSGDIYDMRSEYAVRADGIKQLAGAGAYRPSPEEREDYRRHEFLGRVTRAGGYKGSTASGRPAVPMGLGDYAKAVEELGRQDLPADEKRDRERALLEERNRLAKSAALIVRHGRPDPERFPDPDDLRYAMRLYREAYLTAKDRPE